MEQLKVIKKDDVGKPRPSLIPVIFRQGIRRAAQQLTTTNLLTNIDDVYALVEKYEEGRTRRLGSDIHYIIQASYYLCVLHGLGMPMFLMGLAKVFAVGAEKYAVNDWMRCTYEERFRYVDAFYRHMYAWQEGEMVDEESGCSHMLHAGASLAILHYIDVEGQIANPAPVEKGNVTRAMDEIETSAIRDAQHFAAAVAADAVIQNASSPAPTVVERRRKVLTK